MRLKRITPLSLVLAAFVAFVVAPAGASSVTMGCGDCASANDTGAKPVDGPKTPFREAVMDAHNKERQRWKVPPLVWNQQLADDALVHARYLTQKGFLQHANAAGRTTPQGENLWMGTRGAFNVRQMMDGFLNERAFYVAGALPNISRTGNWADTGHYSQIIWRTTTAVGCAIASSRDFDFLVCRYDPAGNIWGKRADDHDRMASAPAIAVNRKGGAKSYDISYNWP